MMKKPRGFSLIELLVVVAIMAILAALLLPSLSKAKSKAQQTQCMNNVKQLTAAVIIYVSDYGKTVPDIVAGQTGGQTAGWALNLVDYYSKTTNLLLCPVSTRPASNAAGFFYNNGQGSVDTPWSRTFDNGLVRATVTSSYGFNGWFFTDTLNNPSASDGLNYLLPGGMPGSTGYFVRETTVKRPSETPLVSDQNWAECWPLETDPPYIDTFNGRPSTQKTYEMGRMAIVRHGSGHGGAFNGTVSQLPGAINVGCFDGHASLAKLPALWFNYYWHAQWDPSKVRNLSASQ